MSRIRRAGATLAAIALTALVPSPGAFGALGDDGYAGSRFSDIHRAVFSAPYSTLPHYAVDDGVLGPSGDGPDNRLRRASARTLTTRDDLVDFPGGRKLLQPNGICFSGRWQIDIDTVYTGLLAGGARALAVVRASVALGAATRGGRRAFGLAVKLFPTLDREARVRTANLFTLVSLAGSNAAHFLDEPLDNAPGLGGIPGSFGAIFLGLRVRDDLEAAELGTGTERPDAAYRPVTPLAASGLDPSQPVSAPRWIRLQATADTPRVDADDFRDELRLAGYPGRRLEFEVLAADGSAGAKGAADWQRIGKLRLEEDVTSPGCDGRLHFAHPPLSSR